MRLPIPALPVVTLALMLIAVQPLPVMAEGGADQNGPEEDYDAVMARIAAENEAENRKHRNADYYDKQKISNNDKQAIQTLKQHNAEQNQQQTQQEYNRVHGGGGEESQQDQSSYMQQMDQQLSLMVDNNGDYHCVGNKSECKQEIKRIEEACSDPDPNVERKCKVNMSDTRVQAMSDKYGLGLNVKDGTGKNQASTNPADYLPPSHGHKSENGEASSNPGETGAMSMSDAKAHHDHAVNSYTTAMEVEAQARQEHNLANMGTSKAEQQQTAKALAEAKANLQASMKALAQAEKDYDKAQAYEDKMEREREAQRGYNHAVADLSHFQTEYEKAIERELDAAAKLEDAKTKERDPEADARAKSMASAEREKAQRDLDNAKRDLSNAAKGLSEAKEAVENENESKREANRAQGGGTAGRSPDVGGFGQADRGSSNDPDAPDPN